LKVLSSFQIEVFEYWHHAASYLPMQDYRYALPRMESYRNGEARYLKNVDPQLMNEILARVKGEGAIQQRHIDNKVDRSKGSWWNWGEGRRAIEKLFMQGDLMICERNGMAKVYDLRERCLPDQLNLSMPSLYEYAAYLFDTTLRAHGVFTWKQLLHLKTGQPMRDAMRQVVEERIDTGQIQILEQHNGLKAYVDSALFAQTAHQPAQVKILSPFDNLIIHRDRLSSLFEFDYRIECYVPAAKRVYGYFCLPILYGDRFVARIDCKAHRAQQRLEVLSFHLEKTATVDRAQFLPALALELKRFAAFNQCTVVDDGVIQPFFSKH